MLRRVINVPVRFWGLSPATLAACGAFAASTAAALLLPRALGRRRNGGVAAPRTEDEWAEVDTPEP